MVAALPVASCAATSAYHNDAAAATGQEPCWPPCRDAGSSAPAPGLTSMQSTARELLRAMMLLGSNVAHCDAAEYQQQPSAALIGTAAWRQQRAEERRRGGQQQKQQAQPQASSENQQSQPSCQLPSQRELPGGLSFTRPDISPVDLTAKHPGEVGRLRKLATSLWADQRGDSAALAQRSALIIASAAEPNCGNETMPSSSVGEGMAGASVKPPPSELPPRFTDVELMRFAVLSGWTRARNDAEREASLHRAAEQICRTAAWLAHHHFASEAELARFRDLIFWDAPDPSGCPTLHIRLAAAVNVCHGAEAIAFANAIITHMQFAHSMLLHDGGPEQINVVMDCGGASTLAAARISWVFKAVSLTLNHHYPTRLHRLELHDLPVVLRYLVGGVKKLVQPETREKIVLSR